MAEMSDCGYAMVVFVWTWCHVHEDSRLTRRILTSFDIPTLSKTLLIDTIANLEDFNYCLRERREHVSV